MRLGFLTGLESEAMLRAHVESGMIVGEPFRSHAPFDFKGAGMTARIQRYGGVFAEERLTPPPPEVYSLHRKLAGAFFICIRMGAVMQCRDLLEEVYEGYVWGPLPGGAGGVGSTSSSSSVGRGSDAAVTEMLAPSAADRFAVEPQVLR